ncbi:MAG TPA: cyclic nucleotide-binding domain-containing protein [Actinomycetota bacterium]|nr:cyclic nucleotide-binding domain-containing protein [Actinomycetota bacterium]
MKAERLRKIPLFEGLNDHQYERLERWTDEIDVPADKNLVNQGAYPHEFMVIESGTAEVTHDGQHLADLGPGDFFGEMALLLNVPRTATVAATSDITLVVMHERDFRAMEEEIPVVAERVNAIMEERRARPPVQGSDS